MKTLLKALRIVCALVSLAGLFLCLCENTTDTWASDCIKYMVMWFGGAAGTYILKDPKRTAEKVILFFLCISDWVSYWCSLAVYNYRRRHRR